jgi:hypothetical protein
MPAGFLAVLPSIIAGGTAVGATIYGSRQQRKANREALAANKDMTDEQIALERERMAKDEQAWKEEQRLLRERHDAEQRQIQEDMAESRFRWETDEAHAEPYREAGYGALGQLVNRAGLPALAPRQRPTAPSHLLPPPPAAPPVLTGGDRLRPMSDQGRFPMVDTSGWDTVSRPTMLSEDGSPAVTPESYARIATSQEALSAMTPEEEEQFTKEASTIPIAALMKRPARAAVARRA